MNEQFTPELLTQARTAASPEALLALAAENDTTLTPEEAQAYFDQFHQTGELADEELDNVAGGGCKNGGKMIVTVRTQCKNPLNWLCKRCGTGITERDQSGNTDHKCVPGEYSTGNRDFCCYCKYCTYERGLWLCNNPAAYC